MNHFIEDYINSLPHIYKINKKKYVYISRYSPTMEGFFEYIVNVKKNKIKKKYYPLIDTLRFSNKAKEPKTNEEAKILLLINDHSASYPASNIANFISSISPL
jgi:hypothetical protein